MLIFDPRISDVAFNVVLVEGSVTELVAPRIDQNCAPVRDILKIPDFAYSKIAPAQDIFKNCAPVRSILEILSMTFPCGAFAEFGSFMNDDVEAFYTSSILNESQCPSFEVAFLVQKGRYRPPPV